MRSSALLLMCLLILAASVLPAHADPLLPPAPQTPPDVSLVAPGVALPGASLALSVALHRNDASTQDVTLVLVPDGLTLDRITSYRGACDGLTCVLPVTQDAPTIIWLRAHLTNGCAPRVALGVRLLATPVPVHPSVSAPPLAAHRIIVNDAPACRVYLPLAAR